MNRENYLHFLNSAIIDIANWMRFMDAKVGIVLSLCGVIMTGFISLRQEIIQIVNHSCCFYITILILFIFMVLLILAIVLYNGFETIEARIGNLQYKSKWFFTPNSNNQEEDFRKYAQDVFSMNENDIIENMAAELYKLNSIYAAKLKFAGKTIMYAKYFVLIAVLTFVYIISVATWIQMSHKTLLQY